MGKRKYDVTSGRIYTAKKTHRRVVETFEHPKLGTRVVYSMGGNRLHECGYTRFRRWATATAATRVKPERKPAIKLTAAHA